MLPAPYKWDRASGDKIFVRECYRALADAILRDAGLLPPPAADSAPTVSLRLEVNCWTILGNPGS